LAVARVSFGWRWLHVAFAEPLLLANNAGSAEKTKDVQKNGENQCNKKS
jgi:hypothetical protein